MRADVINDLLPGIPEFWRDGAFLMVNQRMAEMFGFDSPSAFSKEVPNIESFYVDLAECTGGCF